MPACRFPCKKIPLGYKTSSFSSVEKAEQTGLILISLGSLIGTGALCYNPGMGEQEDVYVVKVGPKYFWHLISSVSRQQCQQYAMNYFNEQEWQRLEARGIEVHYIKMRDKEVTGLS